MEQTQDERLLQLRGAKAHGTAASLVTNFAVAIDYVEAVRHAAVSMADAIIDRVHDHGHGHLQGSTAVSRHLAAFLGGPMLLDVDAGLLVLRGAGPIRG